MNLTALRRSWPWAATWCAAAAVVLVWSGADAVPALAAGLLAAALVAQVGGPPGAMALAALIPLVTVHGMAGGGVVALFAIGLAGSRRPAWPVLWLLMAGAPFFEPWLTVPATGLLVGVGAAGWVAGTLPASPAASRLAPAWTFLGVAVLVMAAAVAGSHAVASALLGAVAGWAARGVVSIPANLTMSRRLVLAGVALLPTPAILGFLVASIRGNSEHVLVIFASVGVSAAAGVLLLTSHLGGSVLLRSQNRAPLLWALQWGGIAAWVGLAIQAGFSVSLPVLPAILALASPMASIGFLWGAAVWRKTHAPAFEAQPRHVNAAANKKS